MRILENEVIKVSISDFGAELCSVFDKETKRERVWDADFPGGGRAYGKLCLVERADYGAESGVLQ